MDGQVGSGGRPEPTPPSALWASSTAADAEDVQTCTWARVWALPLLLDRLHDPLHHLTVSDKLCDKPEVSSKRQDFFQRALRGRRITWVPACTPPSPAYSVNQVRVSHGVDANCSACPAPLFGKHILPMWFQRVLPTTGFHGHGPKHGHTPHTGPVTGKRDSPLWMCSGNLRDLGHPRFQECKPRTPHREG